MKNSKVPSVPVKLLQPTTELELVDFAGYIAKVAKDGYAHIKAPKSFSIPESSYAHKTLKVRTQTIEKFENGLISATFTKHGQRCHT